MTKSKTVGTLYWIFTILFFALMVFSSWFSLPVNEKAGQLIHGMLGYPQYFIPFTGRAKLLGAIVLLFPGYGRIKEWAYAGLFFDLIAVVYSGIAVSKTFDPLMPTMLIWFLPALQCYIFWHKRQPFFREAKQCRRPGRRRRFRIEDSSDGKKVWQPQAAEQVINITCTPEAVASPTPFPTADLPPGPSIPFGERHPAPAHCRHENIRRTSGDL